MITVALAALVALGVIIVGLRLYMGRAAENRLQPGEDVAIAALRGPLAANAFLACPAGYCAVAEATCSVAGRTRLNRIFLGSELCRNLGDDGLREAAYRGGWRACQHFLEGAIRHVERLYRPAAASA